MGNNFFKSNKLKNQTSDPFFCDLSEPIYNENIIHEPICQYDKDDKKDNKMNEPFCQDNKKDCK